MPMRIKLCNFHEILYTIESTAQGAFPRNFDDLTVSFLEDPALKSAKAGT